MYKTFTRRAYFLYPLTSTINFKVKTYQESFTNFNKVKQVQISQSTLQIGYNKNKGCKNV